MTGRTSKLIAVLAVAAVAGATLMASPVIAGKKKKKKPRVERVEDRDYVGWSGVRGAAEGECTSEPVGCVVFPVEPGEKFVSIEVGDSAGEPVWASVYIYGYNAASDVHEHVCGASDRPFRMADGIEEVVVVVTQTSGGATNPCAGPTTVGTVTATFSNRP
jgi:hypothetical protein